MSGLRLWPLPLATAVLALLTIHASYLVAAAHGHVPWCLPYIDSCTSISATGRQLPEKLLFKPAMTLAALGLLATFWLAAAWLDLLGDPSPRTRRWLRVLAVAGALSSVTYLAALGEGGDSARLLRRTGATLGFAFNFLCELLVLYRVAALRHAHPAVVTPGIYRALAGTMAAWIGLGLLSVGLAAFHAGYHRIDDAFEWTFALILNAFLLPLALAWRRSEFRLGATIGPK